MEMVQDSFCFSPIGREDVGRAAISVPEIAPTKTVHSISRTICDDFGALVLTSNGSMLNE